MIHHIPQCLHRPVMEVGRRHDNISQTRRLERRDITLLPRNEEAPEDRHLAGDRCGVDSRQISLRQFALSLLCQGSDMMPEDSDSNVMKIVVDEKCCIPLILRQSMAEVTTGLGIEQCTTVFGRVADG